MTECAVGGNPHPPADGLLICEPHLQQTSAWLRDVEEEHDRMVNPDEHGLWAAVPSLGNDPNRSRGGALASQLAPARLEAIAASDPRRGAVHLSDFSRGDDLAYDDTASTFDVLHGWAERVRTERTLVRPVVDVVLRMPGSREAGPVCARPCIHHTCQGMADWRSWPAPLTVATEREVLTRQLDWIATQPWITALRSSLGRLRVQLRAHNGTGDPKPVVTCPLPAEDADVCGGPLRYEDPLYSSGGTTTLAHSAVRCGRCGARWEGRTLAYLAIELSNQRKDTPA